MREAARRGYSSPGQASGPPAAMAERAAAARAAGLDPALPGGSRAPTASLWKGQAGGPDGSPAPGAPPLPGAAPVVAGAPPSRAPSKKPAAAPGEEAGSAIAAAGSGAAGLSAAARRLRDAAEASGGQKAAGGLDRGVMAQIDTDAKTDAGLRAAIGRLEKAGKPVTEDAIAEEAEAAGVLKDGGFVRGDPGLAAAIQRAQDPLPPPIPVGAVAEAARNWTSNPPDAATSAAILREADKPRVFPTAPPPKSAVDAYVKHQDTFDQAEKDFGVKPEHILGILGVETGWGRNTGKHPLKTTLLALSGETGPDGRPTRRALQAGRDLAALARLSARGDLGGRKPEDVSGSWAGAMGIPQFLPTSWEAFARSPKGGPKDPFNFDTAAYSVGSYLRSHGYSRDVARSVYGYNHSQEYVDKVLGLSANVAPGVERVKNADASAPGR